MGSNPGKGWQTKYTQFCRCIFVISDYRVWYDRMHIPYDEGLYSVHRASPSVSLCVVNTYRRYAHIFHYLPQEVFKLYVNVVYQLTHTYNAHSGCT